MGKAHSQQRGVMRHRRLVKAVNALIGIVEGVRNVRWSYEGRRLVDTNEWCELYCAWSELRRHEDEAALKKSKPALMSKIKRILNAS